MILSFYGEDFHELPKKSVLNVVINSDPHDDQVRYRRIFSCESADLFWKYYQSQFRILMDRNGVAGLAAEKNVPEDYYADYYCSAYIESVKWWFHNGLKITPEELASFFLRMIQ